MDLIYLININRYLVIIAFAINFALGVLIYQRGRNNITNKCFAAMSLNLAFWALSIAVFHSYPYILINNISMIIGFSVVPTFILFIKNYPDPSKQQSPKLYLLLALWEIYIFIGFFIPRWFTKAIVFKHGLAIWEAGFGYQVTSSLTLPFVLYFLYLLYIRYKDARGIRKTQMKYFFLGLAIFAGFGIILSLALPSVHIERADDFTPTATFFTVVLTAYAITKHRLWDIRIVFVKSIVYSFMLACIASTYVVIITYLIEPIKYRLGIGANTTLVLAGLLIALGYNPFKNLLEKITDKWLYKKRYNPQILIKDLGSIMSSSILLETLTKKLLEKTLEEMRVKKGAFAITNSPTISEVKELGYHMPLSAWKNITPLMKNNRIIVRDELKEGSKEKETLTKLDIDIIISCLIENEPAGYFILGEKKSGDMYSAQDIKFLELFASQAAISLNNAKLFKKEQKKILELNSLNRLSSYLVTTLDLKTLLEHILDQAILSTKADTGSIMLFNKTSKTLSISAAKGLSKEIIEKTKLKSGQDIAGYVFKNKRPLIIGSKSKSPLKEELRRNDISSSLTVPLINKGKAIGVLNINRKNIAKTKQFVQDDLRILVSFAAQAAMAIANAKLYSQAITDGLTSLYNHNHFQVMLSREIKKAKRKSSPLSLIMIDIDNFKRLNDTFGHQEGDKVLRRLSTLLKQNTCKEGLIARYGGEEFAVILPGKDITEASIIAEILRKKVECTILGKRIKITISLGVAALSQLYYENKDKKHIQKEFIKKADDALYSAKGNGRNRVETNSSNQ